MPNSETRVEERTKVQMRARMRDGGPDREFYLVDISSRGMLGMTADPPPRGEFVEVLIGKYALAGHVKWSGARRFGIRLRDRIDVAGLIEGDRESIILPPERRVYNGPKLAAASVDSTRVARAVNTAIVAATLAAVAFIAVETIRSTFGGTMGEAKHAIAAGKKQG